MQTLKQLVQTQNTGLVIALEKIDGSAVQQTMGITSEQCAEIRACLPEDHLRDYSSYDVVDAFFERKSGTWERRVVPLLSRRRRVVPFV